MEDQSDKDLISEEMSSKPPTPERVSSHGSTVKICVDCGTSKTPLWRGGPAGPKSLCNACGIKSRKKRRALLGISKEEKKTKKSTSGKNINNQSSSSTSSTSSSGDCTSRLEDSLKNNRLWSFGRDVAFQRPRSNKTQRRKIGEEEQAAILLMALSCGSVYA